MDFFLKLPFSSITCTWLIFASFYHLSLGSLSTWVISRILVSACMDLSKLKLWPLRHLNGAPIVTRKHIKPKIVFKELARWRLIVISQSSEYRQDIQGFTIHLLLDNMCLLFMSRALQDVHYKPSQDTSLPKCLFFFFPPGLNFKDAWGELWFKIEVVSKLVV